MWSRRSRAGKVRSRLPVCRWIDAGFCASAHTEDVSVGSKADLTAQKSDFRFTPESRLKSNIAPCPKSANRGSRDRREAVVRTRPVDAQARSAKRGSSVSRSLARRRGVWRQDQFRVVDNVADITVVADEADPAVLPFQPHQVAGLLRLRIRPDRDHLPTLDPAWAEPHSLALGVT